MNFKELFEGAEPNMPGAPEGIQIMTPQQFVAKAGDMPGEEVDEGMARGVDAKGRTQQQWIEAVYRKFPDAKIVQAKMIDGPTHAMLPDGRKLSWTKVEAVEEAKRANTQTARQEFSKRPRAELSDKEKAKEKADSDAAWERLMAYAAQQKKELKEVDIDTLNQLASHPMAGVVASAGGAALGATIGKGIEKAADWYKKRQEEKALKKQQGVAEGHDSAEDYREKAEWLRRNLHLSPDEAWERAYDTDPDSWEGTPWEDDYKQGMTESQGGNYAEELAQKIFNQSPDLNSSGSAEEVLGAAYSIARDDLGDLRARMLFTRSEDFPGDLVTNYAHLQKQGVNENINRIRKLSGLDEATKLPASSREFGGDEFQDYMKRIVGTPDLDKEGNVKVDKKGIEKYVSGKTKSDRYKMPYIHRSSVIEYLGPDGQTYSEDAIKKSLSQRPKKLLKQNEKMKHSNGELEQFFNVGFAALTGIAVDEDTDKLIIVNTCPGAGSCKVDCFAMKGGKVQFKAAWQSDGRILTYLLNDPDGFFEQLSNEISKEEADGKKGGYNVTIRWHDAGDFFSPEYLDLALKMAAQHPNVKFYAYTKMAGAALAKKPDNFIINWSEGAHTSQEKQVKAQDTDLERTKNSRIVPDEIFQDLLIKNEKGNLVKGPDGQWQVQPDKLPELKQRLAKEYGLSPSSILSYDEYMSKRKSIPAGMKYNVIVAPGEGDISANDPNIIATLLLKH